jgi:hypothetical protein
MDTRDALKCAIDHIEHMAAWIGRLNSGYSFEALGEDMPGIKAALAGPDAVETLRKALQNAQNALRGIERARVSYGATGFPMGLHPDPAKWMEDFAERAADEIDGVLAAFPARANAARVSEVA